MWYLSFKKVLADENAVAYQIGPVFISLERTYDGVGISIAPTLFRRIGLNHRRCFSPALFFSVAILFYTVTVRIAKPPNLWHYGQKKYQVKNFEYNGLMGVSLPGFARWEITDIVGWSKDPGIIEVTGTDGATHLVPSFCLSDQLLVELPLQPAFSIDHKLKLLVTVPSTSAYFPC
jgi:hypothetical protein